MSTITKSTAPVKNSLRPERRHAQRSRSWAVKVGLRQKPRREYFESSILASDGRTFLSLYSQRVPYFIPNASADCEFRALICTLEWLKHLAAARSKAYITLSATTLAIVRGDVPCPPQLDKLRARLLGQYSSLSGIVWRVDIIPAPPQGAQERRAV